jgi:very-short-patch-repair endonuclease
MRHPTAPDARIADFVASRHGVVSRAELLELGLGPGAIVNRVRSGRLHRLYRGVYAVGHRRLTGPGAWRAAVLACGDGAVLSHRSAAALWQLRVSASAKVDVTVPRDSGRRSVGRIAVHRPRLPAPATVQDAIPVTTPGRTLLDLATVVPKRPLEKAAEAAEALRLDVVVDPAHPGYRRLAAALAQDLTYTTRSALEDAFLELCERHGLPRPLVNHVVAGCEVDFWWPQERLVVEVDGFERHSTRAAFERDRARDALLTAAGADVLRFSHLLVFEAPQTVVDAVLSARSRSLATPG